MSTSRKPVDFGPESHSYGREIQRPLNQLVLVAPLLVAFHVGALFHEFHLVVPRTIGVVFLMLGVTGQFLPALAVVAVLLGQHIVGKDRTRVDLWSVLGMIVESAIWLGPLLALHWILNPNGAAQAAAAGGGDGFLPAVVEAFGAGVYEEFVFRLVLFNVVILVGVDLLGFKRLSVVVAAVILSAVSFAAVHYPLAAWRAWDIPWWKFTFLAAAGAWWGVLFAWRGYGVCAASHVWWNLLVAMLTYR